MNAEYLGNLGRISVVFLFPSLFVAPVVVLIHILAGLAARG